MRPADLYAIGETKLYHIMYLIFNKKRKRDGIDKLGITVIFV